MATIAFRSLCPVLYLLVVVRASQAGNSGAGGFATPYNRYGQAYDPQRHQQPDPMAQQQQQHHQHNQQEQRYRDQRGQYNPQQQQQQQHVTARVTTPTTSSVPSPSSEEAGASEGTGLGVGATRDGSPPLPYGWGELRTSDGRPYYVYYPNGHVQWERPTPPKDPKSDQQEVRQPADGGQWSSSAEPEAVDGGGDGATVIRDVNGGEREIAGGSDGALQRLMEEDDKRGESEMSDAEGTERDIIGAGNELAARAESERALRTDFQSQHVPMGAEWVEGQQAGAPQDQPSVHVEPSASRPSLPDDAAVADPFQGRKPGDSVGGEGSGDDDGGGPSSPPRNSWNDQIRVPHSAGAQGNDRRAEPSSLSSQQNHPLGAWEPSKPWDGTTTSSVPAGPPVFDGEAEAKRPPMWVTDGYGQASPTLPPSRRGPSSGHQHNSTALANDYHWRQSPALGGSTVGDLPPGQAQATNARGQGEWGPSRDLSDRAGEGVESGRGRGSGGASDPWLGCWPRGPDHVKRDTMRADRDGAGAGARDGGDRAGSEAAGGMPGRTPWTEPQYNAPPSGYQQPKQTPLGSGGAYNEPFPPSPHQDSRFQPSQASGSGGGGSETISGSTSWRGQEPPYQDPSQWSPAQPRHSPAGNRPGPGEGRPGWSSSAQGGMSEIGSAGGYGGTARLGAEGRRQQPEGYYGRDGGDYYYQGRAPGRGAPAESPGNGDEYGGYPAGSRALVPRSAYPSGMLEVREQGLQLVKGAWARILVGTGKTRSVLRDYRDWAGIAASNAGVTMKNTVGSVTSRVADVLEGDPQGTPGSRSYRHPPRQDDRYYGGSASFPTTDRTREHDKNNPRSWGSGPPGGYANAPQAAGASLPQAPSSGSYNSGDGRYRAYEGEAENAAASGGYGSGGRRDSHQAGNAEHRGAAGEYYGPQRGFPQTEPGYSYGTGEGGGRAPPGGGGYHHGPSGVAEGGAGIPSYGGQQQRPLQQQQRQPLQQQQRRGEGQGRTGQWQSGGASDGGYWAPC